MFHDSDTPRFQRTRNVHLAMSRIREVAKYLGLSVSVALVLRQHPSDILSHRVQEKALLVTPAQKVAYSGLTWAIYLRHLRIDREMGLLRVVTYLPLFPSNCCRIFEKNTYFRKVASICHNSGTTPFKNSTVAQQMIFGEMLPTHFATIQRVDWIFAINDTKKRLMLNLEKCKIV